MGMMAVKTIRGLTIEIDAATTKLGTELTKIKSSAKGIGEELRTVDKLLKFEATDKVELLSRRFETVKKAVTEAKKEIDLLNKGVEANKKAFDAGEISQAQYEKNLADLNKQLTTANGKYEVLQAELGDTAQKLEDAKRGTDENAQSLGEMADKADEAGKSTLSLGNLIKGNLISGAIIGGLKSVVGAIQNIASAVWNGVKRVGEAAVEYTKDAIDMAAEYQDNVGLLQQLLGDSANDVLEWAETNKRALHLSENATVTALGSFALLFDGMNLGQTQHAICQKKLLR